MAKHQFPASTSEDLANFYSLSLSDPWDRHMNKPKEAGWRMRDAGEKLLGEVTPDSQFQVHWPVHWRRSMKELAEDSRASPESPAGTLQACEQ